MNRRNLDQRLRTALDHAAVNRPEEVLARCGAQDTGPYLLDQPPRRKSPWRAVPAVAAACLVLVISLGLLRPALFQTNAVASVVSLDVNPSIVLTLNAQSRVIEAVEGPYMLSRCQGESYSCHRTDCRLHSIYSEISKLVRDRLDSYTFDSICSCDEAEQAEK